MILHEPLCRHLIEVIVATGHTLTTDVEFTDNALWQFIAVAINDKLRHIQLRTSYGDTFRMRQFSII